MEIEWGHGRHVCCSTFVGTQMVFTYCENNRQMGFWVRKTKEEITITVKDRSRAERIISAIEARESPQPTS